jgi:RNA polymerase sigma factor (sigma-70 family)
MKRETIVHSNRCQLRIVSSEDFAAMHSFTSAGHKSDLDHRARTGRNHRTSFSVQDTSAVSDLRAWSDEQLIAAAKNGRRAPFGELYERHMKRVSYVTRRITRNREDAEDAVQDCFLSAFVHLKDFDGRSRFSTWLTRIAINAALMKLRKKRGLQEVPIDEPNPSSESVAQREFRDGAPDPEESCSLRERKRIVKSAISGLRPRARNVVELFHLQEHSIRETAQILGISTAAVKTRMFRARVTLHRIARAAECRQAQSAEHQVD